MAEPFYVRFNINPPSEEAQKKFMNRIENYVRLLMNGLEDSGRGRELDNLLILVEVKLGEPHLNYASSSHVFIEVWRKRIGNDFSRCLQAVEGLYQALQPEYQNGRDSLNNAVVRALAQSETDLGIAWQEGIFTKKGAKFLDDKLVNEPLRWLGDPAYRNVLTPFKKGLRHFLEGAKEPERLADAIRDMYEATEALAKIVTEKRTKELSALREEFVSKLRLPEPYKKMLREYIDYGCEFRHALEQGKPREWPSPNEAEAFVYLTGLFIRLAIEAMKSV